METTGVGGTDETEFANAAVQAFRDRVAQLLHDDLQQHLHALRVRLGLLAERADRGERVTAGDLRTLAGRVDDTVEVLRQLVADLAAPSAIDLVTALRAAADEARSLHELTVDLDVAGAEGSTLSAAVTAAVIRAVRESLFNVVKHAEVDRARVSVEGRDRTLVVSIADDGVGVQAAQGSAPTGLGSSSLPAVLAAVDGDVEIVSSPEGTTVTITVPTLEV